MMSRFKRSWYLFRSSLYVLNQDRELLIFPLLSALALMTLIASFVLPMLWAISSGYDEEAYFVGWAAYLILFLFYLVSYAIAYYFNTAIVSCAIYRMKGGDPDIRGGFRAANSHLKHILGWALISALFGFLLKLFRDRSGPLGRFALGIVGVSWSVASYLVIPILVMEKKGPVEALKESGRLVKHTWGEQVIGNIGFGVIFFLILIPILVIIPLFVVSESVIVSLIGISILVVYITLVALVHTTLLSIFQAALYLYAREDFVPEGYNRSVMRYSVSDS